MTNPIRSRLPHRSLMLIMAIAWLSFGGCGSNPLGRLAVSGKVTFDGKPLEKGIIDFRPLEGKAIVGSGANIGNGVYTIDSLKGLPPGKYEVRIFSGKEDTRPLPKGMAPAGLRPGIELIPPRFNIQTTLAAEVTAAGPNQFNFDLPAK